MAKITIETFESFKYKQVWEVTEYRDGAIYKTKDTGKYILTVDIPKLPVGYIASSLSTKLMIGDYITLDLW